MSKLPDHEFKAWMAGGKYLPPPMRDFHDQKSIFKAFHEWAVKSEIANRITWIDAHIYVIDVFLWYMAKRGYTLQKARVRYDFSDLTEDVDRQNDRRDHVSHSVLSAYIAAKPQPDQPAQEVDK